MKYVNAASQALQKALSFAKLSPQEHPVFVGVHCRYFLSMNCLDHYSEGEQTSWVRANHTATLTANTIGEQSLCSGKMDVGAFWGVPVGLSSVFHIQIFDTKRYTIEAKKQQQQEHGVLSVANTFTDS